MIQCIRTNAPTRSIFCSSLSRSQNLLRAVETAKSDARDSSRQVQIEIKLRSDLVDLRGERDEALGAAASLKRKVSFVEEDLRVTKTKLARVEQEKIKIERDSRAAISLARSVGTETSSDIDFYKRKVRCYIGLFCVLYWQYPFFMIRVSHSRHPNSTTSYRLNKPFVSNKKLRLKRCVVNRNVR